MRTDVQSDDVLMACLWTTPKLGRRELFTLRADGACLVYTPDGDPVELDSRRLYELLRDKFDPSPPDRENEMQSGSQWARVGRQINVSVPVAGSMARKVSVRGAVIKGDYKLFESGDFIVEDCFFYPLSSSDWTDELKASWKEWRARRDKPEDYDEEPWRVTLPYLPAPPDREVK